MFEGGSAAAMKTKAQMDESTGSQNRNRKRCGESSRGLRPLELRAAHGVQRVACESGHWNGITVHHVIEDFAPGPAWIDLSASQTVAAIVLEQVGGYCEPRSDLDTPSRRAPSPEGHAVFVPAGMTVWRYADQVQRVRDVRLTFDNESLEAWPPDVARGDQSEPALLRYDERVAQCARLLANECSADATGIRLYGEGLTASLTALLFAPVRRPEANRQINGLSPAQLKRVLEYFQERLASDVSLESVAQLTGLSQSQFARAFRASTGVSPYRWFLNARVKRAQSWLLRRTLNIAQVAVEVGFADQSHFTKAFRRATGTTPREWQRRGGLTTHPTSEIQAPALAPEAMRSESKQMM